MPFGYIGQNQTKQQVKNSGVLSSFDISHLEKQGHTGGSLELIESQTISSDTAQVDFTNIKGAKYDVHILQASNIRNATDNQQFAIRMSVGGTFDTDNDYQRAIFTIATNGGTDESRDSNINNIFFTLNQGNATNEKGNGYAYFYNLHNSSKMSFVTLQTTTINVNGQYKMNFGGGVYDQTASVDGIRIFMSNASNIASGVFNLYGVKQI
jgi:hypothetical protein